MPGSQSRLGRGSVSASVVTGREQAWYKLCPAYIACAGESLRQVVGAHRSPSPVTDSTKSRNGMSKSGTSVIRPLEGRSERRVSHYRLYTATVQVLKHSNISPRLCVGAQRRHRLQGSGCFINHRLKHNLPFDFLGDATAESCGCCRRLRD